VIGAHEVGRFGRPTRVVPRETDRALVPVFTGRGRFCFAALILRQKMRRACRWQPGRQTLYLSRDKPPLYGVWAWWSRRLYAEPTGSHPTAGARRTGTGKQPGSSARLGAEISGQEGPDHRTGTQRRPVAEGRARFVRQVRQ